MLTIDIGNSNIVLGLYQEGSWTHNFRYETKSTQPELYYENALRNIFLEWRISPSAVNECAISSVVPDLNEVIKEAVTQVTGFEPIFLTVDLFKNLDIFVPEPYEIGADLVANGYAAIHLHAENCIVVDFGTALTFTVVNKKEGIKGVSIAPGLKTAVHSLSLNTAQLPTVPIALPKSAIGIDTVSAIQSGVMWGYVGLVKELLHKIKSELNGDYKVIATGGLSSILSPLEKEFDVVNKVLTLEGIRLLYLFQKNNN